MLYNIAYLRPGFNGVYASGQCVKKSICFLARTLAIPFNYFSRSHDSSKPNTMLPVTEN